MNVIFQINGGIGKVVAATAVCKSIKVKYPDSKLIVVSGYPDVFLNNPNVDRAFAFGQQQYFYEEYVENQDFIVFAHDPYLDTTHLKFEEHLIETWCRIYDLPFIQKQGEIFLTQREIDFYSQKYISDKPIFLLQTNGGGDSNIKYSWARDIPHNIVRDIIEQFRADYNMVHIRRDDQINYEHAIGVSDNFRSLVVLISLSDKRLLMDSFAQHVAAALNLPSVVLWVVNSHKVFGYDIHTNIIAEPETKKPDIRAAYLNKYNIGGELVEFPYNNEMEIFNIGKILEKFENK
jgi:hypothetical protein